ncbi:MULTISPECIES: hemerythrin domain-containing protein [Pseudomonas]|jgi:hemerythrin-like domain-containing protein|uniref:Hemerythrin domain-containing protein n=1 Tax=Serpens gallinarum TaxID=2763075 RepID=A0ABR8TN87_9PSED|nr:MULTISPECIES: hemerythrin domain-containing protein [Pseudomonas]MBD7977230.1 hemerythrin domain-containing protein [Serpens gallinarum]MBF0674159.1 hemerythrin domain-containing protein [Pseudomonas sp.]
MNALDLLKQDHETVRELLDRLEKTTERAVKSRAEMLQKLQLELQIHTTLEEEIFYPAYTQAGGKEEAVMAAEAKEEHRTVDSLVLPDLLNTDPGSIPFTGRLKVLKELLEHHIEEEEGELFPQAQKLFDKARLDELGLEMKSRKDELKKTLAAQEA